MYIFLIIFFNIVNRKTTQVNQFNHAEHILEILKTRNYEENLENLTNLNFFSTISKYARHYLNYNEYSGLKLPNFKSVMYTSSEGYTFQSKDISFEFDDIPNLNNEENTYFKKIRKYCGLKFFTLLYKRPFFLTFIIILVLFLLYMFLYEI